MSLERKLFPVKHRIPEAPPLEKIPELIAQFKRDKNESLASARDSLFGELEKKNITKRDMSYIWSIAALSYNLHRNERRVTGEPYFTHPISVAKILVDNPYIPKEQLVDHVAIALAHDLFENTGISPSEFEEFAGAEQTQGVRLLSKIIQTENSEKLANDQYFKRLLNNNDMCLWRVKIADWTHNLQTTPKSVDGYYFDKRKKVIKLQSKFAATSKYILPLIRKFPQDERDDQYIWLKNSYEIYRPKRVPDLEPLKNT